MWKIHRWLKKYFIPHEENSYKPHFLSHQSMLIVFLAIIVIELAFLVQVFIVFDKTKFLAAVLPGVLTSLTNEQRANNDAPPLVVNDLLSQAAQLKAEDMATYGYFAHTSPDGKTPWYWFGQVGYRYKSAGENLAVNFFESDDVARAWMNSPTHRANIVRKDFTEIGIGVASGVYQGRNTVFVAQLFGTPFTIAQVTAPGETPQNAVAPITAPGGTPQNAVAPTPITASGGTPQNAVAPAPTQVAVLGEEVAEVAETPIESTASEVAPSGINESKIVLSVEKVLTSPRSSVAYVYGGVSLLILMSLLLAFFIKFEMQHPIVLARGLFLFAVIIALLFVNIRVSHYEIGVPATGLNASVIEAVWGE